MSTKIDIYEYRDYLKKKYGEVLYRVPIDTGGRCPHRRADGTGGCIFCPEDGARAVQLGKSEELEEQLQKGIRFAQRRYNGSAFMAYLQTYTSTFNSLETIKTQVETILQTKGIRAIAFGSRPDCLSTEILEYFENLNKKIDVWVELGVQTCNDQSLNRINRGHNWQTSEEAILRLKKAGLHVAVHLILGLPDENVETMKCSVDTVCNLPIDAIKLHNLHVIKNTELAKLYKKEPFPLLYEHEYCDLLLELLPRIPEKLPIIRLTTDTQEAMLLAPHWSMSKGQFRKYLAKQMRARGVSQGSALRIQNEPVRAASLSKNPEMLVTTDDGSVTFYNDTIKEHYHTLAGARSEALKKYILPGKLENRLATGAVNILDVCFGLGYNSLLSCEKALETGSKLHITALEMDRKVVEMAAENILEEQTRFDWNKCLNTLASKGFWHEGGCSIKLIWGDARYTVKKVTPPFDLIWLDAFSTQRNSELWTTDFFKNLHSLLRPQGALFTYCAAIPVRSGLLEAGFYVGETKSFGRERGGTIAAKDPASIINPLPGRDLHLISTSRGIPYRDPDGTRTNREILRAREFEITEAKKS